MEQYKRTAKMVEKQNLLADLKKIDKYFIDHIDDQSTSPDDRNKDEEEMKRFSLDHIVQERKSVLGLDIYKYSSYPADKQNMIPFIFDKIKDEAIKYVNDFEKTLFDNIDYEKKFISTGDGGFMIFDTPLHALLFNFYFFAALHLFNTGHFFPKLSQYIGEIIVRSAITYDDIFSYEKNYYGKAIIINARILSRDRLNRFLIDKSTYNYFMKNFNGLETLPVITTEDVKRILGIVGDISSWYFDKDVKLPPEQLYTNVKIRNIHIQKIDDLLEKETALPVYNIEIQILADIRDDDEANKKTKFVLSIGNTNTIK
jgi:hypothetical protein